VSLALVGVLAAGSALYLHRERSDRADLYAVSVVTDPDQLSRQTRYDDLAAPVLSAAIGGGVLMTAGAALVEGSAGEGLEWWHVASGAVGLGLGAWGAVALANGGTCEDPSPTDIEQRRDCLAPEMSSELGLVLIAEAVPLLAWPVLALALGGDAPVVTAAPAPGGARVSVTGRF
jgi:hypothetical protein